MQSAPERLALEVPFAQKDLARAAGAKWDKESKSWYAPEGADIEALGRWLPRRREPVALDLSKVAFVLHIPFEDKEAKDHAKAAGAKWDPVRKAWFAPLGKEEALERWKVQPPEYASVADSGGSFADALRVAGLRVDHPIMDGKIHRVPLLEGKGNSKDGAYVGHDDGEPRGFIQNHVTGLKANWFAGSAHRDQMSPSHRAAWAVQTELSRARREAEQEAGYQIAASEAQARWSAIPDGYGVHPYLERKGVLPLGARVSGDMLVIPARDIDGKIWTLQTIPADPDGKKLFMKGGKKAGCFFMIGDIEPGADIMVAEGFATGASLHEATGVSVAVAFDAGNMMPVAKALSERHPASLICLMADNDRWKSVNTGVEKAKEAAREVKGALVVPKFPDDAKSKPTDWNDMMLAEGPDAVLNQVGASLKAERARLREEAIVSLKTERPEYDISMANTKTGTCHGEAKLLAPGFVALLGAAGYATVHETRRIVGALSLGRKYSIEYDKGAAKASLITDRIPKPRPSGPQIPTR